jgi:indolepyruvate decarboxylase
MGFGVPAGLGLQAATGRAPADSGGRRRVPDDRLGAGQLPRYGWDPIVLVFNNASWEMLRTFQPESSFNDLGHWGFAEMAAGMGGDGVRVHTRAELKAALDHAMPRAGASS